MGGGDVLWLDGQSAAGGSTTVQPAAGKTVAITFIGGIVNGGTAPGLVEATSNGTTWRKVAWVANATTVAYDTYGLANAGGRLLINNTNYLRITAPAANTMDFLVVGVEV